MLATIVQPRQPIVVASLDATRVAPLATLLAAVVVLVVFRFQSFPYGVNGACRPERSQGSSSYHLNQGK